MFKPALVGKLADLRALGPETLRKRACVSTGSQELDDQLGGGLACGAVTEIFSEAGQGAWWLAFRTLAQVKDKVCALVEPAANFFPPGAASLGVDLRRLLVIREQNRKQALWALERIARDKSVGATLAAIHKFTDTELRRLQLAAESSGQALILLRPPAELSRASWGAMRLLLSAEPGPGRRVVVEILRMRGAKMPRPILLELDDDSMAVRTSALLPHRAHHPRLAHNAG